MTEKPGALQARPRRALASALRLRPVRLLRRAARRAQLPVWLVGGAVRDLLLGRGHPDLDVAVSRGTADSLARELAAAGVGTVVLLSDESPRVVRVAGRFTLDMAELEGSSIAEDLARRDFTANAMAVELISGRLADPFGGLADLRRRRLRLVKPGNLEEDPLRVLRAARFFATHGLRPDRSLTASVKRAAPLLSRAAPERIAAELTKLLEAPRASPALRWAAAAGVLAPALDRPVGAGAMRRLGRLDAGAVRALPPDRRRSVRLALLGDALDLPAESIAAWLAGRRFSREEGRRAARLVDFGRSAARGSPAQDWPWIVGAGSEASDALRVASLLSPRGKTAARRLSGKLALPIPRLRVTGRDMLAWTGLAPGPRVGALLAALQVEIRRGAIASRSQARAWSRSRAHGEDLQVAEG